MGLASTIWMIFFSAGWIIPFAWSVIATHWFIDKVVWQQVVHLVWPDTIVRPIDPFYWFFFAHYAFAFSMLWLFGVIAFWVTKYARSTRRPEPVDRS